MTKMPNTMTFQLVLTLLIFGRLNFNLIMDLPDSTVKRACARVCVHTFPICVFTRSAVNLRNHLAYFLRQGLSLWDLGLPGSVRLVDQSAVGILLSLVSQPRDHKHAHHQMWALGIKLGTLHLCHRSLQTKLIHSFTVTVILYHQQTYFITICQRVITKS